MQEKVQNPDPGRVLEPIYRTTMAFYVLMAVLLALIGLLAYAWWVQLSQGLVVTGMRDLGVLGGSPWGLYISNFVWFVGVAHGGIAVSAAIRLMKLELYRPIARMAELLTVVSLPMAGLSIIFDLGRPDRLFNMIIYYWDRIGHSPLVWDLTVLVGYFVLSLTYLVITMRQDIAHSVDRLPRIWRPLYRLVLLGYRPNESKKVDQIAWWLAISLIMLMALLSGGVVPWIFGLMVSQPGWFSAVQGPYFLTAALASALAAVIVVAALVRRAFHWEDRIDVRIFQGLGKMLAATSLVYLWFILNEQLTIQYGGPVPERTISEALLFGPFAPFFWTVIAGLVGSVLYLAFQALRPEYFSVKGTFIVSLVTLALLWLKRFLIVVPSLLYPRLPYPSGTYTPTWVEWSLVVGTFAVAAFAYLLFIKIFPLMEPGGEAR